MVLVFSGLVLALPGVQYRTTVNAILAATGLKLSDRIPTDVQNDLEGGVDSGPTE